MRPIRQRNAMDCGPSCLAMIAVLDEEKIVEGGTHEELTSKRG